MKSYLALPILLISVGFLTSCGGAALNEGENYGNILNTSQGLTLTQAEHQIGWGQSECTICHNLENIHLVDRTGITDIKAVHNQALSEGISGCAACHGTNGAP
ncbi:MAG: hypothetical protein A3F82_06230 [Deltaproteobacteria bacterium RIFCSPLOWO2_12_FULL_44_12]|nr:MAG: hypothetical protein A2712_01075 [Deltaproteobacteria bacterium RIFCSPHIGHO2_01_FULL_43_49]OGQ15271.1 MAG: hypothetical protein A3D22_04400 [Deltaproteobacteria bacterium RIFCSPHIGHO2_02_FULL_44_53]OGQ27105.1 MAG: hypothetical protein A3D98_01665 [Deltaproteobacteria bacterium RIFCSPHIGHO2_12_FULL_44_21]OGQ31787.1 MAG: hypothetical protein A2979_05560 [Deltaproteobacteria bacterium RIFCSPLOWO2_01_FULL_45_74]OGQ42989.1 MAG: hypothetical protein A3I70_07865 [Deltaproteobacteria bacterium 